MDKRRILVVDNNAGLRAMLAQVLGDLGHEVVTAGDRDEALAREDLDGFDLIISDLTEDSDSETQPISAIQRKRLFTPVAANGERRAGIVKAFKMGAANFLRLPYNRDELRAIVEQTLSYKSKCVDDPTLLPQIHEMIEFELPSDLSLMNGVLQYLLGRVSRLGIVTPERCESPQNSRQTKLALPLKTKEKVSICTRFRTRAIPPISSRLRAEGCC